MLLLVLLGLPLLFALCVFLARSRTLNLILSVSYAAFHLFCAIWFIFVPVSLGDYLGTDSLTAVFFPVLSILYLSCSVYTIGYFRTAHDTGGSRTHESNYFVFMFLFVFSMSGFVFSRNVGMLWVFIEATTLATTYLIDFEKTPSSREAAWKYIFTCSVGIAFAFVGIIFLSKSSGASVNSLFLDNLYRNAGHFDPFFLKLAFLFILLGFGTKMGLAPMHSWLPDAHSEAPAPVSAMLSGTLLNMAFLGIMRVYKVMVLSGLGAFAKILFFALGFLSLAFSAAFILRVKNYKKMLAYSSVENMGIIGIGIATGGGAVFAAMLHLVGHSFTKAGFFLSAGNVARLYGSREIADTGGLMRQEPKTAWVLFLSLVSILGLPPFPLFFSEFLMVKEMISRHLIVGLVAFLLLLTVIMYGMAKSVFRILFGKTRTITGSVSLTMIFPQVFLLILLLALALALPGPVVDLLRRASAALTG